MSKYHTPPHLLEESMSESGLVIIRFVSCSGRVVAHHRWSRGGRRHRRWCSDRCTRRSSARLRWYHHRGCAGWLSNRGWQRFNHGVIPSRPRTLPGRFCLKFCRLQGQVVHNLYLVSVAFPVLMILSFNQVRQGTQTFYHHSFHPLWVQKSIAKLATTY